MEIQITTLGNLSKSRRFDFWESLREHSRRSTKIYYSTNCKRVILAFTKNKLSLLFYLKHLIELKINMNAPIII